MQKLSLLLAFFLVFSQRSQAQTTGQDARNADSSTFYAFPEDWVGNWAGMLHIYGVDTLLMQVPMQLRLMPLDTSKEGRYSWHIIYGEDKGDSRPYELVPIRPEKGQWLIDEKNSIAMESYLRGNMLLCWFVVQENRILCLYERTAEGIRFEIVAGAEKSVSTTGNGHSEEEGDIPEVLTYPISGYQKALLQRE